MSCSTLSTPPTELISLLICLHMPMCQLFISSLQICVTHWLQAGGSHVHNDVFTLQQRKNDSKGLFIFVHLRAMTGTGHLSF